MSSSSKSKKSVAKFINSDKEKKNNNKINNSLSNNKSINSNNENKDDKNINIKEFNNLDNENNNINKNIAKNVLNMNNIQIDGLINEGIISLKDYKKEKQNILDINNIDNMDYEKILKKIMGLNSSLKSLEKEKFRLNNEKSVFLNGFNESNYKRNDNLKDLNFFQNFNYSNDDNYSDNKRYLSNTHNKNDLLKQYEDDLNFFNDLITGFNEEFGLIK